MLLRDYQAEMLLRLHEAWRKHRCVMVQMPTGTGKTHLMAAVIREAAAGGVLIVAHRQELISQISQTLGLFGIGHGGRYAPNLGGDLSAPVQVASIQTLSRRIASGDSLEKEGEEAWKPSLVIIDEAHHALAKTYRMLWEQWPEAKFLGLTATPCRLNGQGFTDLFEVLLQSQDIEAFIGQGWLSDFEYVSVRPDSLAMQQVGALRKRGADGDYQTKEMATVMDCPESIAHLYRCYRAYAEGKRGIVYAIDKAHAQHICAYYSDKGISSCVIHAGTPEGERCRLVNDYREGLIDVMVNVDIFSEGFDCPEVEFIQLVRPTLSLSKYLQQVGRGMRVTKGKEYVLILDQVGLYQTFGLPTEAREWSRMFLGQLAGKGSLTEGKPIVIREDADRKELVNLEMVPVRRHGEDNKGLEIFMQGGRYGVMMDGKVTCRAEFEHIRRLEGRYFALGVYPFLSHRSKTTVIDDRGYDLRASLYGRVEQEGDIFKGSTIEGATQYWDAKGGRYYKAPPQVERIGRIEVMRTGNRYQLRHQSLRTNFFFEKQDVLYSDDLTIIGKVLIVRNEVKHPYHILAYWGDSVIVDETDLYGYKQILSNGRMGAPFRQIPPYVSSTPNLYKLRLQRAK